MGKAGRGEHERRFSAVVLTLAAALVAVLALASTPSQAETRRAFLIGVERYSDGFIQRLDRTVNDAKDLAKDLEEVGFDKKNIKVVSDLKNRDAFEKEFSAFLKTIESGDTVLFFFSGHGFGVEAEQTNYLLFTDLKSPFTFTKSQLTEQERKNADVVRLRIPAFLDAYQQSEIPNGISATEIQRRLAERNPRTVILILDACRSLVAADVSDAQDAKPVKRGNDSGSRLLTVRQPPPGFLVFYSASFGEQAVEKLGTFDTGRNSLFTDVLRSELQRPGQSLVALADRVKLMVRSIANAKGIQQEPEYFYNGTIVEDFHLVGSIGRERFQMAQDKCAGELDDWEQIKSLQKRDLLDRHRRRFDGCGTAELARRALSELALTSDDPIAAPVAVANRSVSECDRLAASDQDRARPPEVPGVLWEKIDADAAIEACTTAVADNPRVARYLYNLGRAYQRLGAQPGLDEAERTRALRSARLAYDDATKRGYVSALNDLAVLYENGDGVEANGAQAIQLLKQAAQQGDPLAMYNLALHYKNGTNDVKRDVAQAAEWFAKSAESGSVSAMVELGDALLNGRGQAQNPRRGMEWLQRAADAGSVRAKFLLGLNYLRGKPCTCGGEDSPNSLQQDPDLALLWFGRVAETGDSDAQAILARIMETGIGLLNPQPEIAERYWRLAAYGGSASAQFEFADQLRQGFLLVKQEYGDQEAITLLQRSMSQGFPQAALALAQINRTGELGQAKRPIEAMRLAYHAIDLAVLTDPMTDEGNPFYEIAAAHLLVEMAKSGEAVDPMGRPLLTQEEVGTLEHYYGAVDPVTKKVTIRRLSVPISCRIKRAGPGRSDVTWGYRRSLWVWDWGRPESPTEPQMRNIERALGCSDDGDLRNTLIDVYQQAKKNKVAFADLIDQKIKTAQGLAEPAQKKSKQR
jgi:TPR repeat protein